MELISYTCNDVQVGCISSKHSEVIISRGRKTTEKLIMRRIKFAEKFEINQEYILKGNPLNGNNSKRTKNDGN